MSETIIQLRRDTRSKWNEVNPVLATGEIGIETDTKYLKIGKNSRHWAELLKLPQFTSSDFSDLLVL